MFCDCLDGNKILHTALHCIHIHLFSFGSQYVFISYLSLFIYTLLQEEPRMSEKYSKPIGSKGMPLQLTEKGLASLSQDCASIRVTGNICFPSVCEIGEGLLPREEHQTML